MRIGKQKNEKQKVGLREAVNEFMSSFINFLKRNKLYSAFNLLDEPRQSIKEFDYKIQATFRQ